MRYLRRRMRVPGSIRWSYPSAVPARAAAGNPAAQVLALPASSEANPGGFTGDGLGRKHARYREWMLCSLRRLGFRAAQRRSADAASGILI